jgi:hypothetical protein
MKHSLIQALQTIQNNGGGMSRIAANTWAAPRRPEVAHSDETVAELARRGLAVMCGNSAIVMVEAGRVALIDFEDAHVG